MSTKQELLQDIEKLPTFELTNAYVQKDGQYLEQVYKAVVEKGVQVPEALTFVSPRYKLVQFKEIFAPIVQNIENCSGHVDTYGGFARMILYPQVEGFGDKWGIIAMNSVDRTSSIVIRFCVKHKDKVITLPAKVAGYEKPHTAKAAINVQDFITVVTKVKDTWGSIVEKFEKYEMTIDNMNDVLENLKIKEKKVFKNLKEILEQHNRTYTLWEFFMDLIDYVSNKKHKSSIHKAKKLDQICNGIISYAMVLDI